MLVKRAKRGANRNRCGLLPIEACAEATQQINHVSAAVDLTKIIAIQAAHEPSLRTTHQFVGESHEK